jgi:hypothetical protein
MSSRDEFEKWGDGVRDYDTQYLAWKAACELKDKEIKDLKRAHYNLTVMHGDAQDELAALRTANKDPQDWFDATKAELEKVDTEKNRLLDVEIGLREELDAMKKNIRCSYCDGSGDIHRADGEWMGECPCAKSVPAIPDGFVLVSVETLNLFPEINMQNYDVLDVDALNNWAIEMIAASQKEVKP